jgi:hypothetical protein
LAFTILLRQLTETILYFIGFFLPKATKGGGSNYII